MHTGHAFVFPHARAGFSGGDVRISRPGDYTTRRNGAAGGDNRSLMQQTSATGLMSTECQRR